MNREFLLAWTQSPTIQASIKAAMEGMAMPHLFITDFGNMPVPIPPREEQVEIMKRLKRDLDTIESLGVAADTTTTDLTTLKQSLLAKAFRGELVPQDPADEPASVLLARLKAEREATPKPKRSRTSKSARKR